MNVHSNLVQDIADADIEAALLGAMMVPESANTAYARARPLLDVDYFFYTPNRLIYEAIQALHDDGRAVTFMTVKNHLPDDNQSGDDSAAAYLLQVNGAACPLMAVSDYAGLVREMWGRRRMQDIAGLAVDLAQAKGQSVMASLTTMDDHLADIRRVLSSEGIPMDMRAAADAANRIMHGKAGEHEIGIKPCFPSVTNVLQDDLMAGQLYGLLGASGEGKTSFILHLLRHAAEQGHPTALLSRDQSDLKCINQMCSQSLKIEEWRIRKNVLSDEHMRLLEAERERIANLPITVIPFSRSKIDSVLTRADAFVDEAKRHTLKAPFIVIDHIRAIAPDDPRADAGTIAQVKNSKFKDWAVDRGCVAMMLNQRNGQGAKDIEKMLPRPTDSDLYGGEAAREDYDTILGIFRAEWWRDKALKKIPESDGSRRRKIEERYGDCDGKIEVSLVKARHGNPRRAETLKFEGVYTRVSEIEQEQPSLIDGAPF